MLVDEVEGLFYSMKKQDWAKKQLRKYYQGTSPTDNFMIRWKAIY